MEAPEPQALLETQIFFDFRGVAGELSLRPLEEAVLEGSQRGVFLYHLAQAALAFRPPLGLFGRVRTEEGFVDLKRSALAPVVSLARLYALLAGSPARGTLERLKAAEGSSLSPEGAGRLAEAFRFFFHLRLKHQLLAWQKGEAIGNRVLWAALSPGEKRQALEASGPSRRSRKAPQAASSCDEAKGLRPLPAGPFALPPAPGAFLPAAPRPLWASFPLPLPLWGLGPGGPPGLPPLP